MATATATRPRWAVALAALAVTILAATGLTPTPTAEAASNDGPRAPAVAYCDGVLEVWSTFVPIMHWQIVSAQCALVVDDRPGIDVLNASFSAEGLGYRCESFGVRWRSAGFRFTGFGLGSDGGDSSGTLSTGGGEAELSNFHVLSPYTATFEHDATTTGSSGPGTFQLTYQGGNALSLSCPEPNHQWETQVGIKVVLDEDLIGDAQRLIGEAEDEIFETIGDATDETEACADWLASEGEAGSRSACGPAAGLAEDVWDLRDDALETVDDAVEDAEACADWLASEGNNGSRDACGPAASIAEDAWQARDDAVETVGDAAGDVTDTAEQLQSDVEEAADDAEACADWLASEGQTGSRDACGPAASIAEDAWQARDDAIEDAGDAEDQAEQALADAQACGAWLSSEGTNGSRDACGPLAGAAELVWDLRDDVLDIIGDVVPTPPVLHPSAECDDGPVVADGFSHGTYVKLRAEQEGDTTRTCFRADGDSTGFGGRVDIADPQGAGSVDVGEEIACTSEPLLAGEVGDPDDPATHAPFEVTVEDTGSEVRLCVLVGDVERTITTTASPEATFDVLLDDPDPYATAEPWPLGPSATCTSSDGHERHLDLETAGDTRVRLASLVEGEERAHVCVRADGPAGVGGVLTVDVSGSPGAQPVVATASDTVGCELNVLSLEAPAEVSVTRSSTGTLPASVCVEVEGEVLRVTAGTEGEPVAPTVSWTPDPGTPG